MTDERFVISWVPGIHFGPGPVVRSAGGLPGVFGVLVPLADSQLALSSMQRQLWASQRRNPASPHQNTALLSTIEGAVDSERLAAAFAQVVAASDVLRTCIDGENVTISPSLVETELLRMSRPETSRWAAERARSPLAMSEGGIDSVFIEHPDHTVSWYLNLHHVITDATASSAVFAAAAAAYYDKPLEIPSYYQWAEHLRATPFDARAKRAERHWESRSPMSRVGRLYEAADGTDSASLRRPIQLDPTKHRALLERLETDYASLSTDLAWTSLLVTASALYLHRVTGSEEMAIGLPVHNRSTPGAEAVFGPVMQVFPIDVRIDRSDTHRSLHKRIAKSVMTTIRNARPGVTPSPTDIEAVVNVIPRGGIEGFGEFAVTTEWIHPGATDPSHLFQLQLTSYADAEPRLAIDVNKVAAGAQADQIADHFRSVIDGLVTDPDSPIGSAPIISGTELSAVRAWGDRRSEAPTADLLPALLEASLPTATLTHNEIQLVGPELLAAVRRTASWLQTDLGVQPGDRVAVQMDRSAQAVLAFLGLWFSGASYVPIDPCQPELRRASLIERAGCVATLTKLPDDCLMGSDPALDVDRVDVGPDAEAYLLFTSGSTGEPKGVPITHQGVADYLHFARTHYLSVGDSPIVPLFSALTFDLTVTSVFLPLLTGGELIVIEPDGVAGLKQIAETPRITWAKATPSHLELFLRLAPADHSLRSLVIGGEALGARLTRDLWAWQPELRMFNEYGPTEAVVGCMIYEAAPTDAYAEVPIGRPAPGVELRIVDAHNQDVPRGSPGELLISSRGVTTGYLGTEPGSGPFVQLDGQRFYRSGDLVRFVAPDVVTYLGRADEQIKVGGIRLDPTEVEFQLEQHPLIRRAAVRLAGDVLAAWFETTGDPSPIELRTWLAERVPSHALPVVYVPMGELPTTTNGKLDVRSLTESTEAHRVGSGTDDGAISAMEQRILNLWSSQLQLETIGVNVEFFDLGGDSLAGMQSVFLLAESLGLDLPEELIFANRSARQLAAAVERGDFGTAATVTSSGQIPSLSPGERAMVFAWLNDPDSTANNVGRSYRVNGTLNPAKLEQAAQGLVERHLPLQLTYVEPRRMLSTDESLDFVIGEPADAASAEEVADTFFTQTFDPDVGARLRVLLTPLTDGDTSVVLTMHHALIDEAGLDRLFGDLAHLYDGDALVELPISYERFASTQNGRSTSDVDRDFWLTQPSGSTLVFDGANEADGYIQLPATFTADHLDRFDGINAAAVSLSAAAEVLGRRADGDSVEIGMPLSVRSSQDHDLAGYALNVLPLVIDLADPLASAPTALNGALTHRNYPFASVVSDRRSAGMTLPSMSVLLAFGSLAKASIGGFPAEHRVLAPNTATTDVTLFVQVRGDGVNLAIEYSGSAMTARVASDLLTEFEARLAGISVSAPVAVPHEWLSEPLTATIPNLVLDDIVAVHAAASPEAVAVSHGDTKLSYAELIGQANAIAHQIAESGLASGSFVGVIANRSLGVVPAILGTLRAGCAYVPIDPDYPADRIETIIEDSGIDVVLIPIGVSAPELSVSTLACTNETADSPPTVERAVDDAAYAIFTSGSTGRPKGVEVNHANIVYSTTVRHQVYSHSPAAFLLLSSFAFDSSMVGLWWTLCTGGEIVLPDSGLHTDVDHMGELIKGRGVTHLLSIPSLYSVLLDEIDPALLASLNTVMVAGEACPPNLVTSHCAKLPGAGLHNEYGPTETTVWSHHHLFAADYNHAQPIPIGRPIPGSTQLVLDAGGQPVSADQSGELFVGGLGVTVGYVGQSELTDQRFVTIDGDRYYRTGDLVRWLATGELEFLGRVDHQVKVRGVRIELAEVESTVLTDSAIQSAAAGTIESSLGTRLALWIVVQPGAHVSEQDLRARLSDRLPAAMVPSVVVELESMPLTPNGKVDRASLAVPDLEVQSREASPQTGSNATQTAMLDIWTEVLGRPNISPTDNFFDLGGDSILSIRIVSGLRRHGIRIKPRDLFDHPTIAQLETIAQVQTEENTPAIDRFTGPALLLPMQEWFFQQGFADPNHWNQSMWFELGESIDIERLEQAFATVLDHHDSLRAVFTETELGWIQRIAETVPTVRVQEFNDLSPEAIPAVTASIEAGMDIEGGKLVGAGLFRSSEGDRLFVTIHHLVIDGVSWRPIIEDLTAAYRDQTLPARTSPVAAFGAALTALPADPHWDLISATLPTPSQARHLETAGQQIAVSVDGGRTDGLFERMLSSIAEAHREVFGSDRLTATLEGHGRADEVGEELDLSRTVGWFTAMYPISLDPTEPVVLDAPLGGVGALDQVPTMPRLVINYLGQVDRAIVGTNLLTPASGIEAGYGPRNHRTHDLGIMAHVSGGQLQVTWDFVPADHPTALVREASEAFVRHFTTAPSFDLVQLSESDLATLDEIFS